MTAPEGPAAGRGTSVMTREQYREYCEEHGERMAPASVRKKGPRARLVLDFGEAHGAATLTVECEPAARAKWRGWLDERKATMGGRILE